MAARANNWREKQEGLYAHNRKPGRGAFWKGIANRRVRRRANRVYDEMVEGKREIIGVVRRDDRTILPVSEVDSSVRKRTTPARELRPAVRGYWWELRSLDPKAWEVLSSLHSRESEDTVERGREDGGKELGSA